MSFSYLGFDRLHPIISTYRTSSFAHPCVTRLCPIIPTSCAASPLFSWSHSSSRWDSHFHSYVLTIYIRLYWLWEFLVFYSLVRRGYIRKVSVQLVPKYFSRDCSTGSISCSKQKNRMKKILKQDSNSRQIQDIVPVSNLKARKIKTLLSFPIHLAHHRFAATAVALLLLRCRSDAAAVAPSVATLSLLLLLMLSLRCHSCCRSCRSCCRYAVAPSIAPAVTLLPLLLLIYCWSDVAPLSLRYQSTVTPLLLCWCCCHSWCCSFCLLDFSRSSPQEAESG